MRINNIKEFIFSSSASVYGHSTRQPITEESKVDPLSVYAKTKAASEKLIKEHTLKGALKAISLRYFNPLGAHGDLVIYENPMTEFGNIMPKLLRVFLKIDSDFSIFGDDYNTRDGTGERDYLHISDLIEGHFLALSHLKNISNYDVFNLGTGKGITVLELLNTFEKASGIDIQKNFKNRRLGDVDVCYSDSSKSNKILKWSAKKSLLDMCNDSIQSIEKNIDEL
jgi:UDP-glucose 4-epimerase